VAVEGMAFVQPVQVGDEVNLYAKLVATGRTSMRAADEAWRRGRDVEDTTGVTEAVFTSVALDGERRPRALP
jgi:acyl-CoA thioesterase YciA